MKKKILWAGVALLALTVTVLIAAWPRYLPVMRFLGDAPPREAFEEMVNLAELIVLADVKSVKQGPNYVVRFEGTTDVDRVPTQRVTLEVIKVYRGQAAPGQMLTLWQYAVGVTWSGMAPGFMISEDDPVYERGEQYVLMLVGPMSIPEEFRPHQPEPWQEGMYEELYRVVYPEGRMLLNENGRVTCVLDTFDTNGKTLAEIEKMIATSPVFSRDDLDGAREVLFSYLSSLHAGRYDEAVNLYGGSYDILRDWNPAIDPNDYAALFESGCETNGLMCLDTAGFLLKEVVSPHEFKFNVEFITGDGSLFVTGSETSPQSKFFFTVARNEDGKFLVQDLPVYAP